MANSALVWTAVVICCVTTIKARQLPSDSQLATNDRPWDYLMYVQRWPPSVCDGMPRQKCEIPSQITDWVIHGLWPNYNDGTWPSFCDKQDKFDVSKVEVFRPALEQEWPNLEQGRTEESLWAHEWEKHGTCAKTLSTLSDEKSYFSHSLDLYNNYHIGNALAKNKIVPSNTRSYTKAQIEQALRDNLGNGTDLFELACVHGELPRVESENDIEYRRRQHISSKSNGGKKGVAQLVEARACVDKQLIIMSCPTKPSSMIINFMSANLRNKRAVFDLAAMLSPGPVTSAGAQSNLDLSAGDDACPETGAIYIPTF